MSSGSQDQNTSTNTSSVPDPSSFHHHRRGSITPGTSPATSLFQRRNSLAATTAPPPLFSTPATASTIAGSGELHHRRRVSVSTSLGLTGSPGSTFIFRRSSMSTNSNPDSIDESAVDEDGNNSPSTSFARRMSFSTQAIRGLRASVPAGSPGTTDQGGFDWSEQLRARARSSVNGVRPAFSTSPPRDSAAQAAMNSSKPSEMPAPPTQPIRARPEPRPKPDAYQERILKGDFYMD